MRALRTVVALAALAGVTAGATPTWAKTAFQDWAQGRGVYVYSKDHPPGGLSDVFLSGAGQLPPAPPAYYDPYGRAVPPAPGYDDAPGY